MKPIVIIFIIFILVIIIGGMILSAIQIKNLKQILTKELNGHVVEISIKFANCYISVDKKIVDQISSYKMDSCKLTAKVDDFDIVVNIGSGFLKPRIITFVNGLKDTDLSNC